MWARISDNIVRETTDIDPDGRYHPALQWVECGDEVREGWSFDGAQFAAPQGPAPTFAERRAALIREADLLAKAKRDAIVADYSAAEMASWPIKRAEALAWQASGDAADAPNLAIEAQARQAALADLVARVLAKSATLAQLEAQIAGHTGYLHDRLREVADGDEDALAAIDINAGWPV